MKVRQAARAFRLGTRPELVVVLMIPLVLASTFLFMRVFDIDLHKISLGALIIALGLLVDDAIIAVEMMVRKMEESLSRFDGATFTYTSTAMPMLTSTLIAAAGFLPIGLAKSAAGEHTFSVFSVNALALLISWVVAVLFTPYIGYVLLKVKQTAITNCSTRLSTCAFSSSRAVRSMVPREEVGTGNCRDSVSANRQRPSRAVCEKSGQATKKSSKMQS